MWLGRFYNAVLICTGRFGSVSQSLFHPSSRGRGDETGAEGASALLASIGSSPGGRGISSRNECIDILPGAGCIRRSLEILEKLDRSPGGSGIARIDSSPLGHSVSSRYDKLSLGAFSQADGLLGVLGLVGSDRSSSFFVLRLGVFGSGDASACCAMMYIPTGIFVPDASFRLQDAEEVAIHNNVVPSSIFDPDVKRAVVDRDKGAEWGNYGCLCDDGSLYAESAMDGKLSLCIVGNRLKRKRQS
jgi:hypothetical protein